MKKAFVNNLQRVIGVGNECTMDDLRRIAHHVDCGIAEFASVVDGLRDNGILMKKPNGTFQVLS